MTKPREGISLAPPPHSLWWGILCGVRWRASSLVSTQQMPPPSPTLILATEGPQAFPNVPWEGIPFPVENHASERAGKGNLMPAVSRSVLLPGPREQHTAFIGRHTKRLGVIFFLVLTSPVLLSRIILSSSSVSSFSVSWTCLYQKKGINFFEDLEKIGYTMNWVVFSLFPGAALIIQFL